MPTHDIASQASTGDRHTPNTFQACQARGSCTQFYARSIQIASNMNDKLVGCDGTRPNFTWSHSSWAFLAILAKTLTKIITFLDAFVGGVERSRVVYFVY